MSEKLPPVTELAALFAKYDRTPRQGWVLNNDTNEACIVGVLGLEQHLTGPGHAFYPQLDAIYDVNTHVLAAGFDEAFRDSELRCSCGTCTNLRADKGGDFTIGYQVGLAVQGKPVNA